MKLNSKKIKHFQNKILSYYKENKRDLPWRKTTDAYSIWISEIMLQQTQVDRVISYYERWLKKWPTVSKLAGAGRQEVLKMWMGLGYNSRALNLHKSSQIIHEQFDGNVARAMMNFKQLPGVGPYTSSAVRIFAQNKNMVTVDTNIRRILIHEFGLDENISDADLWELAEQCLPTGQSRDWHNALMDYGATLLTARRSGIKPKTQQSAFEGSDRQIRSAIMRILLTKQTISRPQLEKEIPHECTTSRLDSILGKLEKEHIIAVQNGKIVFA